MGKRPANYRLDKLKTEIELKVKIRTFTRRGERQKKDGVEFLRLIKTPPYNTCINIGQLINMLKTRREQIAVELKKLDRYLPDYQLSIFDDPKEISEEEQKKAEIVKKNLNDESHFLHKCMGIAANPEYFD